MASHGFLAVIDQESAKIDHYLRANLKTHVPLIAEIGEHILLGGGKRIRPMLFVLCARLAGYRGDSEYYFSTVFEYLHAATLLHDDVIDNAEIRRGKQSANMVWGNSAAVLVGDFLYSQCFNLAVEMENLRVLEVLSDTTNRMAEGMVLELVHSFDFTMDFDAYLEIITAKTAVLMSAACRIGGMLGDLPEPMEERLGAFGLELGIAFQMVDDALDYSLTEQQFGKPVGKDLAEGKVTLPLIYTLKHCKEEERRRLLELCDRDSYNEAHFGEIMSLLNRYQAVEYSMDQAKTYMERARSYLAHFPDTPGRQQLLDLAEFVIERRF